MAPRSPAPALSVAQGLRRTLPYAALLLAWWLGARGLGAASFWYDELLSVGLATGPDFVGRLLAREPYPPLYYGLLKGWLWAAGARPYAPGLEPARGLEFLARLPSLAAAVLAVAALAALARRWRLPAAGAAPFLLAAHPLFLWYAREARMYPLWMALLLLALLGLATRRGRLWALAAGAALLTHYFALLPILAAALSALWLRPRPPWRWLAAPFAPFALWLLLALPVVSAFRNIAPGAAPTLPIFLRELGPDLLLADPVLRPAGYAAEPAWGYGLLAAGALGLALRAWRDPERGLLPAGAFTFGVLGLFVFWQVRPVHEVRYLAWALPLLLLGLTSLPAALAGPRAAAGGLAALAVAAAGWGLAAAGVIQAAPRTTWAPDFRALAAFLNEHRAPGDRGLAIPGYGVNVLAVYTSPVNLDAGPEVGERVRVDDGAAWLAAARPEPGGRLWLLLFQDEVVDPGRVLLGTLEQAGSYRADSFYSREARLFAYAGAGAPVALSPDLRLDAAFEGGIRLTGAAVRRPPGESALLAVYLFWELTSPQTRYLTGAVHLARAPGEPPLVQRDKLVLNEFWPAPTLPVGEVLADRYELQLPGDLAPGVYTLSALLYDPETGARRRLPDGAETVPLGAFQVP